MALGVDEKGEKILDTIYINLRSFKKGVLEQMLAYSFLHHALYFFPDPHARAQVVATIATRDVPLPKFQPIPVYLCQQILILPI